MTAATLSGFCDVAITLSTSFHKNRNIGLNLTQNAFSRYSSHASGHPRGQVIIDQSLSGTPFHFYWHCDTFYLKHNTENEHTRSTQVQRESQLGQPTRNNNGDDMRAIHTSKRVTGAAATCLALTLTGPAVAAENILTMKLEHTTNDHALTLPKIAITRVFDDASSLTLEKSWFWQEGVHESGWPKHDEGFVNYSLPGWKFGSQDRWTLTPQLGAKFRSNVTRALAALKLGFRGDGWSLSGRYRYEHETTHETAVEGRAGRVDLYASYAITDDWTLLYNPHYHFKQENDSPDFGTGDRDYLEQEFLAFRKLNANNTLFGGYIRRAPNSSQSSTDPDQRVNSWLIGYQYKF